MDAWAGEGTCYDYLCLRALINTLVRKPVLLRAMQAEQKKKQESGRGNTQYEYVE